MAAITAPFMARGCTYPRRARWSKRAGAGATCGTSLRRQRARRPHRFRRPLLAIRRNAL